MIQAKLHQNQVTPATICNDSFKLIDTLASEGVTSSSEGAHRSVLKRWLIVENILPRSEGAQPAPTILCNELCGCGSIVDFIPMTSNPLLPPVLNGAIAPTHQLNLHVKNPSLLLFCVKDAPAITTLSLQLIVESLLLLRDFERQQLWQ